MSTSATYKAAVARMTSYTYGHPILQLCSRALAVIAAFATIRQKSAALLTSN